MNKFFIISILFCATISCKEKNQYPEDLIKEETVNSPESLANKDTSNTETITKDSITEETVDEAPVEGKLNNSVDLSNEVAAFISCRENTKQRMGCRNYITKIIAKTYGISEFDDPDNEYVVFDNIQSIISDSEKWKDLGTVSKESLEKASAHTNNGGLSLVIDTKNTYGHVVMLVPGESQMSGTWGLELPNAVSLTNYKPEKSFVNKSIAYAFKKSDALKVFIRE